MNENYELHQVVKNSDKSRFELEIDGYSVYRL